jgi:hypothetical protein
MGARRGQGAQRDLQCVERGCLSLAAAWNELAAFYDLPVAEPLAMSTVSEMSEKGPLWDSIVARYGLHATPYEQIANWSFVDWMLNFGEETILTRFARQASLIASIRMRVLDGNSRSFGNSG